MNTENNNNNNNSNESNPENGNNNPENANNGVTGHEGTVAGTPAPAEANPAITDAAPLASTTPLVENPSNPFPIPENIKVSMKGSMKKSAEVPSGTTLKAALEKAGYSKSEMEGFSYREGDTSRPVALDRVLTASMEVTAVTKTRTA